MKANELRIGNLIIFDNLISGEQIIEVTPRFFSSLAGGRDFEDQKNNTELNNYYKPIPLTEEWLLKFGFEKGNKYWHNGLGSNIFYDLDNKYLRQAYGTGVNITMFAISAMNIQYVHQLQNLYFALTGEELTVK